MKKSRLQKLIRESRYENKEKPISIFEAFLMIVGTVIFIYSWMR